MKRILNICILAITALMIYSCATNDDGKDYAPTEYVYENNFTLTLDDSSISDYSANVIYKATAKGQAHAVLVTSNQPAPDFKTIYYKSYKSAEIDTVATYTFEVEQDKPYTIKAKKLNVDENYTLYAIHETVDGFVAEKAPLSVTFKTIDTIDPIFLKDSSTPKHDTINVDPFDKVVLQFSEPVFYKGGDITFTGSKGRIITVNNPDVIKTEESSIIIETHGTFPQDDIISVTWDAGVFADTFGRTVAALNSDEYTFETRKFSDKETVFLMQGDYNYTVTFNATGSLKQYHENLPSSTFPADSGTFKLVLDPTDATGMTLLGINIFSGHPNPEPKTFKITFGGNDKIIAPTTRVASFIEIPDLATPKSTEWGSQIINTIKDAGSYNFEAGEITHKKALYYTETGNLYDFLDYNYKRIGTYK